MVEILHTKCHKNLNYGSHNSNNSAKLHMCTKVLKLALCCEQVINYMCIRTQVTGALGIVTCISWLTFQAEPDSSVINVLTQEVTTSALTHSLKEDAYETLQMFSYYCDWYFELLNIHSQGNFQSKSFPVLQFWS